MPHPKQNGLAGQVSRKTVKGKRPKGKARTATGELRYRSKEKNKRGLRGQRELREDPVFYEKAIEAFTIGTSTVGACQMLGITDATYRTWRLQARKLMDEKPEGWENTLAVRFWRDLEKARGEFKQTQLMLIQQASSKGGKWQASAWLLERLYPDEFALMRRVELSGRGGKPVEVDNKSTVSGKVGLFMDNLSDEQMELLAAELEDEEQDEE